MLGILLGIAIIGAIAITGTLDSSPNTHEMNVINDDNSTHTVYVSVTKNNETIFEETRELNGGQRWNVTTVNKSGTYQIHIRVDDETRKTEEIELPVEEEDKRSFTDIRITDDGTVTVRTYWQQ
jgi:hypothetical protein